MSCLRITVLGSPSVQRDHQPARFLTRKALALLCYLAVEATPVSRDHVIALLWPDSDGKRGRTALRTTLTHLRDGLQESAAAPVFLDLTGDTLAIRRAADVVVDVDAINRAASYRPPQPAQSAQSADLRTQLEQAVAIYHGDFLEGFSLTDAPEFDDWVSLQRERWHQRFSQVLDRLSQLAFDSGEFGRGLDAAQRWVAHDPLNEVAHRRLMQLHLAAGNRSGALAAYDACRAILERELNAEPAGETQALATRARTQTLPTAEEDIAPHRPAGPTRASLSATPLIGRAHEHQALITAYRKARLGQPQGVLLVGEPGIGKTRLAHEFAGWAAAQGAAVLRGSAVDTRTHLPYQLWIDALRRRMDGSQDPGPLRTLAPMWRAELARFLPEIEEMAPYLPADASTAEQAPDSAPDPAQPANTDWVSTDSQSRLFEAVFRATLALSRSQPLVVLFDDLQWADTASLDVLLYVSHRWIETQRPLLLVATVREADIAAIQTPLSALKRQLPHTTLQLGPLSQPDTQALVQAMLQTLTQPSASQAASQSSAFSSLDQAIATSSLQFGDRLFDETAGHPLYLIETLKALHEAEPVQLSHADGVIAGGLDAATDITTETLHRWQQTLKDWVAPGVVDVIQARLQHLTPVESSLLNALSVLGQGSSFDACLSVAGLAAETSVDPVFTGLENCQTRGLIRETGTGALFFTHDKIREVVYAGLGTARRRNLHRRAGTWLEASLVGRDARAQDQLAPRMAWHFETAGDPRTWVYLHRAGQAAIRMFAYEDAIRHFDRAIVWLQSSHDLAHFNPLKSASKTDAPAQAADDIALKQRIIEVYTGKASAHTQRADYGPAILACEALEKLARRWNDPHLIANLLVWRASQLALPGQHGNFDLAEALAQEALGMATAQNQLPEQANAWLTLARVSCWRAHFAISVEQSQKALDIFQVHPLPLLEAYALNDLATTHLFAHDFAAAHQIQQRALPLWHQTDRPSMLVNNLCIGMRTAIRTGRFADAVALFNESRPIWVQIRDTWAHLNSITNAGLAFVECGDEAQGIGYLETALQLMADRSLPVLRALASTDLARICIAAGTPERAQPWVSSALELTARELPTWQGVLLPVLAQLAVAQGDLGRARAWVLESERFLTRSPTPPIAHLQLDAAQADLELALGHAPVALQYQRRHIEACRKQGLRQFLPLALRQQARVLAALGQRDEAAEALREARAAAEAMDAKWSLRQVLDTPLAL